MLYRRLIILLFLLSYPLLIEAQRRSEQRIDEIVFKGLKNSEVSYLNQFLQAKPHQIFNDSIAQSDVQRLKNIAAIGNARYQIDTTGDQTQLVYHIEEVKTLLPIVNFGGIKGNFWFQLGFSDINWRGKGQFLSAAYQNNDGRHSGNVYYKVPRIKTSNWGYSLSLSHWASREPLYFKTATVNYDYDNTSGAFSIIRHFGFHRNLEVGGTLFREKYKKSKIQFIENPPGPEEVIQMKSLSKLTYKEDFLNYHLFYLKGLAWRVTVQNVYNFSDKFWFNSFQFQGRHFTRIGKLGNLAIRLRLGIATNNESPFAPFVADSHVNIRGIGNRIDRGTAQIILNTEYRQSILQLSNWGAQIVVFSDIGSWRTPGGDLSELFDSNLFRQFVGGGFRLIYNKIYGAIFRIDYGIDVFNTNQRGLVIGLGQYF
jgi:outer membrane protein assembly factor BamA